MAQPVVERVLRAGSRVGHLPSAVACATALVAGAGVALLVPGQGSHPFVLVAFVLYATHCALRPDHRWDAFGTPLAVSVAYQLLGALVDLPWAAAVVALLVTLAALLLLDRHAAGERRLRPVLSPAR